MDKLFTFLNTPWFVGLSSGLFVAIINFLFTREKTNAEVEKLQAETQKLKSETEKLQIDIQKFTAQTNVLTQEISSNSENIASINYTLSTKGEVVIYDSNATGDIGFDFKGTGGKIYAKNSDGKDEPITKQGTGDLKFEKGTLILERTNTDGRFEILLESYLINGVRKQSIPKDTLVDTNKKMRLNCEIKVTKGEHTLKFIFKGQESQKWATQLERKFTEDKWIQTTLYFNLPTKEDVRLRIDNQNVTEINSCIMIRNIILTEKI